MYVEWVRQGTAAEGGYDRRSKQRGRARLQQAPSTIYRRLGTGERW